MSLKNRSICMSLLSVFETFLRIFYSKTMKFVDFLLANSRSTWKMRGFWSQKFRRFPAFVRHGKCENVHKNSEDFKLSVNRNSERFLASFFPPINFWSLLTWNASIFMDGILAKFVNFFGVQLDERRKGFLYLSKF